jgi:replication factor C subunit 3/5
LILFFFRAIFTLKLLLGNLNLNYIFKTFSDVGIYDRVVVQEIIKELAQTQQIDKTKKPFKGIFVYFVCVCTNFILVVVINDAERLSKDAQHALRRTMEKYSSNIRFILCCSSVGRIISPIRSRCLLIRFSSPKNEEVI